MSSWWQDVIDWAWHQPTIGQEIGVQSGTTAPATAADQAVGGLSGLAQTIGAIWTNLRDYKMWRSLGWLLLGVVLMFLGVAWWLGPSSARMSPLGIARRQLG